MGYQSQVAFRGLCSRRLWLPDQFLKQRSKMDHGLPQVFGVGFPTCLAKRALMSSPVIIENQWMVHGDIGRALFKVAHWIAPSRHHIAEQLVGLGYCSAGPVNEARLHSGPGFDEPRTIA
jgi:hypothetical protein